MGGLEWGSDRAEMTITEKKKTKPKKKNCSLFFLSSIGSRTVSAVGQVATVV